MISLGNRNAKHAVTDEELSAFADGELPPHRARRVAAEIRAHPRFADRIHAYWRREAALWRALDPVFQESVPHIEAPRARRWPTAAALIVAALLVTGGALHLTGSDPAPARFADMVLQAYMQPARASGEVSAPRLFSGLGLQPLSQKQLQLGGREIMEYRYQDAGANRLALYEMDRHTAIQDGWFHVMSDKSVPLVRWQQGSKSYLLVGDLELSELTRTAMAMQRKISSPRAAPEQTVPGPAGPPSSGTASGAPTPRDAGTTPATRAPAPTGNNS
jgi:hypothetical protein